MSFSYLYLSIFFCKVCCFNLSEIIIFLSKWQLLFSPCVFQITDAAMCSLADHAKNLEELYVSSVYGVTDFGVSQLSFKGLSLKTLDVSYCFRVSDKGLVGILKRPQETNLLKSLRIKGCAKVSCKCIIVKNCSHIKLNCLSNFLN